jgi:hypothetical protein
VSAVLAFANKDIPTHAGIFGFIAIETLITFRATKVRAQDEQRHYRHRDSTDCESA